jgi:tellurite resistance protein TehA-like permease
MGTGIVANAAATLPFRLPGLHEFALVVWVLAAAGQARLTLLLGCYAMFGISLFMSVIVITLLWGRLVTQRALPSVLVPTCWIALGPLGQSVTATGGLGTVAPLALRPPYAEGAAVLALLYGVPAWGFAMAWLVIAAALTLQAARRGLPFALLLAAWLTAAVRTVHDGARGRLFLPLRALS